MAQLPNDVAMRIISFMDIDTRRTLGIYTKLKIPVELEKKLSACIKPVRGDIISHDDVYYWVNSWRDLSSTDSFVHAWAHHCYKGEWRYVYEYKKIDDHKVINHTEYVYGYNNRSVKKIHTEANWSYDQYLMFAGF